jgi:Asp-tRNA(Asn)/Glu-tRNA(Gln) amidotransferase A subunit family amidase
MAWEWAHHRDALSQLMQRGVAQGLAVPLPDYRAACRVAETRRAEVAALFERVDILLTPCVPGEAPAGLASAGDPRLQELWTLLHLPSISLPTHAGPRGLPVGIQLVGARWDDERLLAAAAWTLERLGAWQ